MTQPHPQVLVLTCALLTQSACLNRPGSDFESGTETATVVPSPIDMVLVRANTFEMGCTEGQTYCYRNQTHHTVTLTHDYYVGVTEVTRAQFAAAMGYDPSNKTDCEGECPVQALTWYEAAAYSNALSAAGGLAECYNCTKSGSDVECESAGSPYECLGYRLLTEAEWESAARCGGDLDYSGSDTAADVAWTSENSGSTDHPVAQLAPNACGTYDMSGNAEEWTHDLWDMYGDGDYHAAETDPAGDATGFATCRGGWWSADAPTSRVSRGDFHYPTSNWVSLGVRLGRTAD